MHSDIQKLETPRHILKPWITMRHYIQVHVYMHDIKKLLSTQLYRFWVPDLEANLIVLCENA